MKRRSKAGGKTSKARGRKALKPKRRDASENAPSSTPIQRAEVARLTSELNEALEQQSATADVLRMISSSPSDIHPILDPIVRTAGELCASEYAILFTLRDGKYHVACSNKADAEFVKFFSEHPVSVDRGSLVGRTALARRSVHIEDCLTDPEYKLHEAAQLGRHRTMLGVPLLREGIPIGVIGLLRTQVKPFSEKQIELVTTFANQAVIALENARLLNELRQRTDDLTERTADLTEALEQQTATSEVLQVISTSPGDLQPVFAAMLEKAVRICDATFGNIYRWDGEVLHLVAAHNTPPAFAEYRAHSPVTPGTGSATSVPGRMVATKAVVHVGDLSSDQAYIDGNPQTVAAVELGGTRTLVAAPMLKDDKLIGGISLVRREVRPFSDEQIALLTNFAAQAVIAIKNARLLNELRQSLEQQTATSEVLGVISGSPGELEPVFAAILENATRLCSAHFGNLLLYEGGTFRFAAMHNAPKEWASFRKREPLADLNPLMPAPRVAASRRAIQIIDLTEDDLYKQGDPDAVALVELAGARTLVVVPMLKDEEVVGVIAIYRREVHAFDENQVGLLQNFAAQAVIAIENARLLNELRQRTADLTERTADLTETLEQQTATSEVLQVITSSPGNLQPVFASMLQKALHICEAKFGMLALYENDLWRTAAVDRPSLAENTPGSKWGHWLLVEPRRFGPETALGRLAQTKRLIHIPDVRKDVESTGVSPTRSAFLETGARSLLAAPLLKEGKLIGTIALYRQELRPFTDKQIAVIENFAAQAVIAIENAHLLKELQERTDQVTQLNQHLEQRVTDQVG